MKYVNKYKKLIITILVICFVITFSVVSNADVGSFQRYDSGSSSSSSSWGGSSSSSSWDSDSGGSSLDLIFLIMFFIKHPILGTILIIILIIMARVRKNNRVEPNIRHRTNTYEEAIPNMAVDTGEIANRIREIDSDFSAQSFLAFGKDVFIKLQHAWTKRDWSGIRPFESNELFAQHSSQLQEYINTNRINVVDRIAINYAELYSFREDGDKEMLAITLKAVMKDYIIDATTKEVLEGDKTTDRYMSYKLTFVRKAGVKTKPGTDETVTTNCPNCGAPTKITSSGECSYCHSIITTGEHGWVLANLEPFNI